MLFDMHLYKMEISHLLLEYATLTYMNISSLLFSNTSTVNDCTGTIGTQIPAQLMIVLVH